MLFRREAIEAQQASWLGDILLARLPATWMLGGLAASAAVAVLAFLTFASYARRTEVHGQLVPAQGMAIVLSPASGVVTQIATEQGAKVASGDYLATVDVPRSTAKDGDTVDALMKRLDRRNQSIKSMELAARKVLIAQRRGVISQISAAREELSQLDVEVATRRKLTAIADSTLSRMRSLGNSGYVSKVQLEQQQAAKLRAIADVQAAQRQMTILRSNIVKLQQAADEIPGKLSSNQASANRDMAILEEERLKLRAQGTQAVRAPVSGVVAAQMIKAGQAVQAGQPLLSLLPGDGLLEAELMVPSNAIGFIEVGDEVLLRYEAFPYQKFGQQPGRVSRVSRSPLKLGGIATGDSAVGAPLYRVSVVLARQSIIAYGSPVALKPGMALEADVLGDRRRLIEWIFEPLYSMKGRM